MNDGTNDALIFDKRHLHAIDAIMKILNPVLAATVLCLTSTSAISAVFEIRGLKIEMIRAVGQYPDPVYKNTVEVWFTTPLVFPAGTGCTDSRRVYISAGNSHLVAAAYLGHSMGRTVNIALDNALPIRGGACEVSFFDVHTQ